MWLPTRSSRAFPPGRSATATAICATNSRGAPCRSIDRRGGGCGRRKSGAANVQNLSIESFDKFGGIAESCYFCIGLSRRRWYETQWTCIATGYSARERGRWGRKVVTSRVACRAAASGGGLRTGNRRPVRRTLARTDRGLPRHGVSWRSRFFFEQETTI